VVIDEIGKMECLCDDFRAAVLRAVDSDRAVLGTVMQRGDPWVEQLKRHANVTIVTVTRQNREHLFEQLAALFAG
jgi:nucleoside-triphosphatase